MKGTEKSIQKQLRDLLAGILLASCAAIALCIFASAHLVRDNNRFLDGIGVLSDFYEIAGEMDVSARSYVSDKNEQDYLKYKELKKRAEGELDRLSSLFSQDTAVRISFLGNMLETYDERFSEQDSGGSWYACYQDLAYRNRLLQDTEGRYHELLVDSIRKKWESGSGHGFCRSPASALFFLFCWREPPCSPQDITGASPDPYWRW